MTSDGSDCENNDDHKVPDQPPPYTEGTTGLPPTVGPTTTTTMHTSTSTAVGASMTVITGQPTGVVYQGNMNFVPVGINMGPGPFIGPQESTLTCPSCQQRITTKVEYKITMRNHIFALMFCMVGCLPCILIPYCVKSCRNADHYCPECNAFLGTYMRT
uniref:LITAF domain-containing protein n=1 Tax=Heliothis virescens TaxID=7102 RepID=A0A2A4JBS3_HELVI